MRKARIGSYGNFSIYRIDGGFFCDSPQGAAHFDVVASGASREDQRNSAPRQVKNFWRACDSAAGMVASGEIDKSEFADEVERKVAEAEHGKRKFKFTPYGRRVSGSCNCLNIKSGEE